MHDRPAAATILVGVDLGFPHFDAELEELGQLAQTAGMEPVARVACKRKAPDAALFVGKGKADEIKALAEEIGASEILFDQSLSPAQQRNLEKHMDMPVNDRTMLGAGRTWSGRPAAPACAAARAKSRSSWTAG
ncbi:MAG: hflX [Ramlibacter sp.]|nr:hflX [Ramlibacter sp.]